MIILYIIIGLVAAQRLMELIVSSRNTEKLLGRGGHEVGRRHYPLFVILHFSWLATLLVAVEADRSIHLPWLLLFLALQGARFWVVISLGEFWTTRIITVPHTPLIQHGPYRFCRHPNYVIVIGEIAALPLAFGAWGVMIIFSALNSLLLMHRIKVENAALQDRRSIMNKYHLETNRNTGHEISSENQEVQ